MQTKLKEWIYEREAFAGIECVQKEGHLCYQLCILKKDKTNAKILKQERDIPSLETLKEHLEEDMPIFLNFNVKGILNRALDYVPNSNEEALLAVFPSAKVEDFYVQQVEAADVTFVSVMRQDSIHQLLKDFEDAGLWVVHAFVGPFMVEHILATIPDAQQLQTAQHLLEIQAGHLIRFSKNEAAPKQSFMIGEQRVFEEGLLALSMAYLGIANPDLPGVRDTLILEKQEAFYYKKLFYYTSILALGFFFVALLLNYFLFEHYNGQQQTFEIDLAQQQSLVLQRDSLAKKIADKKALLGDQMHLGQSKSSYYADQLAATLPSTLQLTKVVFFPIIKEKNYTGEEKLPRYDNSKIQVTGLCQASVFYNNWKRSLEELDWVQAIHNISYQNSNNNQGVFELEITLNRE